MNRHDVTEILLKVVLNTITLTLNLNMEERVDINYHYDYKVILNLPFGLALVLQ